MTNALPILASDACPVPSPQPAPIVGHSLRCCWPKWPHASRPTQEFCGAKSKPGKSWCVEHCKAVFHHKPEPNISQRTEYYIAFAASVSKLEADPMQTPGVVEALPPA